MKNLIKINILIISILILLTGCESVNVEMQEENSILEKSKIENATLQQKIDYANYHLLEVGKYVSKLSTSKNFNSILFNAIDKRIEKGNDSEIKVKDLIEIANRQNASSLNEKETENLKKELTAFYNLDGKDWNTVIYIPNFEEQKQRMSRATYDNTKPLLVPVVEENDDEEVENMYRAYQEDSNGNVVELNFEVAESEFENSTYDRLIILKIGEDDVYSDTSGSNNNYPNEPNLFLQGMKVKYHKESSGRSEVEFKSKLERINYDGTYTEMSSFNKQYSFERRWIRNKNWKTKNDNVTVYSSNGIAPINQTIYS